LITGFLNFRGGMDATRTRPQPGLGMTGTYANQLNPHPGERRGRVDVMDDEKAVGNEHEYPNLQ